MESTTTSTTSAGRPAASSTQAPMQRQFVNFAFYKLDPFHTTESRTNIIPGKRKFLFVYPFVKTRDWYLLPLEKRQVVMDEHIKMGNKYPSVKLNTTYSFGLDDQDFVVAFESDEPKDFLDLVMELRETESSKFTQRDTPIFTCIQMPMERILDQLF